MAKAVRDLLEAFYNVFYKMLLRLWLCLWGKVGRGRPKDEEEREGEGWKLVAEHPEASGSNTQGMG